MRGWMRRLRAAFVVEGTVAGPVAEAPPVPLAAIVRRFWPYARRYRPWLALTLLFIVLDAALETAAIWLFKVLVDQVFVPRDVQALVWVAAACGGESFAVIRDAAPGLPGTVRGGVFVLAAAGFAAKAGMVSLVAVLASLYPAVTVLLARQFHGERLLGVQRLGVTSVLAGAALIGLGGAAA